MTAQQLCTLGGINFSPNATTQSSIKEKTVSYTQTVGNKASGVGGFYTIRDRFNTDRKIMLEWDFLNSAMYNVLDTLASVETAQTFTDWLGDSYQVIVNNPTNTSIIRGSVDAYVGVKIELDVVSGS